MYSSCSRFTFREIVRERERAIRRVSYVGMAYKNQRHQRIKGHKLKKKDLVMVVDDSSSSSSNNGGGTFTNGP